MKTSQRGIDLLKESEGLRLKAYQCSAGVWTVGFGTTNATGLIDIKRDTVITKPQAEELLKRSLRSYEDAVNDYVKVPLNQSQYDSLVNFIYNIGEGAFKKSTLLKKLNRGGYASIPSEMMRWNKVGGKVNRGLVNRRTKEAALWSEDDWQADDEPAEPVEVKREVPTVVNAENINATAALATGVGAMNLDGSSPMSYALAIIAVMTASVFLYLFVKRRGA